jgi:hypothetical protein
MSASGVVVPILHKLDKYLYHLNTTCKLLYENAHNWQVVVLPVQLPFFFFTRPKWYMKFRTIDQSMIPSQGEDVQAGSSSVFWPLAEQQGALGAFSSWHASAAGWSHTRSSSEYSPYSLSPSGTDPSEYSIFDDFPLPHTVALRLCLLLFSRSSFHDSFLLCFLLLSWASRQTTY